MQIGKIQALQISRFTQHGAYLKSMSDEEVLLPNKFILPSFKVGDSIEVFLYTDSLDRPVATTQKPHGTLNEILPLKILSIQNNGCFLDLGIDKDIFMPTKNPLRFKIGENVVVRISTDKQNRLIAKLGIKEHLIAFRGKEKYIRVQILPFETTPLGIGCVVEQKYYGLVYKNQIFSTVNFGEYQDGYIIKIRSDGKLDISLKPIDNKLDEKDRLLKLIATQKILKLDFNSSPETIKEICQMSKKSFKTIINALLKESKIKIISNPDNPDKKSIQLAE